MAYEDYINFPSDEDALKAPKIGRNYYPYVKGRHFCYVNGVGEWIVKYYNLTKFLGKTRNTNIAIQRVDALRKRGVQIIGYGWLHKANPVCVELVNDLQDCAYIKEERDKMIALKAEREAAERLEKIKAEQNERAKLIASIKDELRKEIEAEVKKGKKANG